MTEHIVTAQAGPTAAAPLLSLRRVEKTYGSRGVVTNALRGVSFDVVRGEFVAIMGPSGSGKSTLLNCVATIDAPTAGQVLLEGEDLSCLKGGSLAKFRREKLGFIFQDSNLLETLTGFENIALALSLKGTKSSAVKSLVDSVAKSLDITDVLGKFPGQMSGGQQQRVAAARAVVAHPSLVLADEPTGALDSRNSTVLLETLSRMNRDLGATLMMVTHDSYAASYSSRVIFIKDGALFTEIRRGDAERKEYYERILEVVAFLGGEVTGHAC